MATRSLNKVLLIGNLTRDPELRYTPQGTPVCTFGLATNRSWSTDDGDKREETEFHTVVAWNRLAEIVAEFLAKGKQVYVEGRLSTREWEAQDGTKRRTTEIVSNEVIFLGGAPQQRPAEALDIPADFGGGAKPESPAAKDPAGQDAVAEDQPEKAPVDKAVTEAAKKQKKSEGDIPF